MYKEFIVIFALILTGYFARKKHILDEEMNRGLNKFIINIAYPCLILNRMSNLDMPDGAFMNFVLVTLIAIVIFLLLGGYSYLYCKIRKVDKEDAPVVEFAMFAPNNGFLGFPFAVTFFGDLGLLYMIAHNTALNIIFFSYCISLMKRGRGIPGRRLIDKIIEMIRLMINPKISSAIIGLIICKCGVQLPGTLSSYLSLVGGIATPMAMIFIGSTLANCTIGETFKNKVVMEAGIHKLFIIPIITMALVYFLPLDPLATAILIFGNAISVATTVPIFAEQYDRNKELASQILLVTTIGALATIPAWVMFLTKFLL